MPVTPPAAALTRLAKAAIALELFLSVGAIGGGLALMLGPHGEILPLPVAALAGSPFTDYSLPGAVLFVVLGIGPLLAAILAWRRHRQAPLLVIALGAALLIWMGVEIAVVGYTNDPPLQPIHLTLGVVILLVGVGWWRQAGSHGAA